MFDDPVVLSTRFPQKLWRIVNECKTGAIKWGTNGLTVLLDYKKFQVEYLATNSAVFKTKNITSFIRQLNLYGFRKVTSHSRDPLCNSRNPDVHEFLHDDFRSGRIDLLHRVCRKTGVKSRARQRNNSLNVVERQTNFAKVKTQGNRLSRLQLCQLALTKTLEQYTREYRQERFFDEIVNYRISENTSYPHGLSSGTYCIDFLNPDEDLSAQWVDQCAISACNKCQCYPKRSL